ncbi:Protein pangolin:-like isoforms A/H/I [Dinothrombium tinctorium]|uniref:Protein pangolin:-like isoforms A/H/I n=1 Tax=Dinothrombium tinctorium TaxID=1965070 RepID=A0A3S3QVN9_9ACAR|nr:Protein pangolin:-like isoforms A/H/I [Dinothrombium tinctorium]RWS14715.1 Protein pangolin:-like isoforms A/H/I [Dinothrombium tinctorium]RWS14720.1 Protein pangolin:-like isoforms A/H/I [Dinothrombium tinctorium]
MPQSGVGDDLASSDEIKVFEDEGDDEKPAENLTELKSSLITEGEQVPCVCGVRLPSPLTASVCRLQDKAEDGSYASSSKAVSRPDVPLLGKPFDPLWHPSHLGYVVPPYHSNGSPMVTLGFAALHAVPNADETCTSYVIHLFIRTLHPISRFIES